MRRSLLPVGAFLALMPQAFADEIVFDQIRAFYVEQATGKLSANIMPPADTIDFWNTMIGEGGATGGGGSDVLLVAHFKSIKSEVLSPRINLVVKDRDTGKPMMERKNIHVFYDHEGADGAPVSFAKAVFLEEVQCTPLAITVEIVGRSGTKVHTAELPFACGE